MGWKSDLRFLVLFSADSASAGAKFSLQINGRDGVMPNCGKLDSSSPLSALECCVHISLDRRTFLQWNKDRSSHASWRFGAFSRRDIVADPLHYSDYQNHPECIPITRITLSGDSHYGPRCLPICGGRIARALEKPTCNCHPRPTVFATCAAHFRGRFGTVPVPAGHASRGLQSAPQKGTLEDHEPPGPIAGPRRPVEHGAPVPRPRQRLHRRHGRARSLQRDQARAASPARRQPPCRPRFWRRRWSTAWRSTLARCAHWPRPRCG